ncbi:flavin-containing monooxygenase FMO GS-OX-like 2 [Belonocnema kinseyi]|uniref:flavin-containing monooxygenase FMO GS-OX-like 2 n=1 Tax=Belonocnema kinseyi TaxID=2817044 RepID=UPI00143D2D41|nr:flavin-containing monooxygenase FMO GS-OX-like 2 [Belonocnema kinseyi]
MKMCSRKRVCVIGGGAAGLCALRHLASDLHNFEPEAFEQSGDIGGTWVYTEKTGFDENGLPIHTSMYRDLRSNAPCELMNFPDFRQMKSEKGSGVHRKVLLSYLHDYANHFQVLQFIKFYTKVESVRPEIIKTDEENLTIWYVKIKDVKTKQIEDKIFDAVMVCSGNYSQPNIPKIPGIETFPGRILHSHSYRIPEEFSGKSVMILGSAFSATDIAVELAPHADIIYLSNRNERITSLLPPSVIQVPGIKKVEGNIIFFTDGSSISVEAFMYCTGYSIQFPFLDKTCGISVDDNYVFPIYKHTININHPTMCFLGINSYVITFPMFHVKARYYMAFLKKQFSLPSKEIMLEDSKLKVSKKRHAHRKALDVWTIIRESDLWHYKDYKIILSEDDKDAQIIYDP